MSNCKSCVKQNPLGKFNECVWHEKTKDTGREYSDQTLFPNKVCPFMYHTLYPYFLGFLFGASYDYNKKGDCQVCCPAFKSVDVLVKKRPNDGKFDKEVPADWRDVIYAEVIKVNGTCPSGHRVGDRFVFPTTRTMRTKYMCPAALNNIFPFLKMKVPECIDINNLKCPDWEQGVMFNVSQK